MSEGVIRAFLEDIALHPADDVPRLIFADWLSDNGQEDRAEFIRLGIEAEAFRDEQCAQCRAVENWQALPDVPCYCTPRWSDYVRRFHELENGKDWTHIHPDIPRGRWGVPLQWRFSRGAISGVQTGFRQWRAYGARIVRLNPVEFVSLADKRPNHPAWWHCVRSGYHVGFGPRSPRSPSELPKDTFDLLDGFSASMQESQNTDARKSWATPGDAVAALSRALIRWAWLQEDSSADRP